MTRRRQQERRDATGVDDGSSYKLVTLFALVYMAPRLAFSARHAPTVEAIAKSARIKG
jgi:hypothetical protein